jgi:hypothetical protein
VIIPPGIIVLMFLGLAGFVNRIAHGSKTVVLQAGEMRVEHPDGSWTVEKFDLAEPVEPDAPFPEEAK